VAQFPHGAAQKKQQYDKLLLLGVGSNRFDSPFR
jgi:hypothetical protein